MPSPAPTAAEQTVLALYAAFGAGDGAKILALCSENTVWTLHAPKEHPYGGVHRGRAGVGAFLGGLAANVEILGFDVKERFASGDTVVVLGHEKARWKSTGKTYEVEWVHVWRVEKGLARRFEEFYDTASAMAAGRA